MEPGQAGEAKPSGAGTTARHLHFSGRVQGVGFRWLVRGAAHEFKLVGWVKNLPDGRVEAWLQGESAQVEAALSRLACAGPPARVDRLEAVECPPMEHARFTVIR